MGNWTELLRTLIDLEGKRCSLKLLLKGNRKKTERRPERKIDNERRKFRN